MFFGNQQRAWFLESAARVMLAMLVKPYSPTLNSPAQPSPAQPSPALPCRLHQTRCRACDSVSEKSRWFWKILSYFEDTSNSAPAPAPAAAAPGIHILLVVPYLCCTQRPPCIPKRCTLPSQVISILPNVLKYYMTSLKYYVTS